MAPPDWAVRLAQHGTGIVFFDELFSAPPAVQAALLRVVLERHVGSLRLPERVRIVAAANPPASAADGWHLSPPLANRFVHLHWNRVPWPVARGPWPAYRGPWHHRDPADEEPADHHGPLVGEHEPVQAPDDETPPGPDQDAPRDPVAGAGRQPLEVGGVDAAGQVADTEEGEQRGADPEDRSLGQEDRVAYPLAPVPFGRRGPMPSSASDAWDKLRDTIRQCGGWPICMTDGKDLRESRSVAVGLGSVNDGERRCQQMSRHEEASGGAPACPPQVMSPVDALLACEPPLFDADGAHGSTSHPGMGRRRTGLPRHRLAIAKRPALEAGRTDEQADSALVRKEANVGG